MIDVEVRHYVLSGHDDPAAIRTACGWRPKNQQPLDMQLQAGVRAFYAAQAEDLFHVNCSACRLALKKGKVS